MYSPKIREDLVPRIYRAAKEQKLPMTAWVSQAVELCLRETAPEPQPAAQRKDDSYESNKPR